MKRKGVFDLPAVAIVTFVMSGRVGRALEVEGRGGGNPKTGKGVMLSKAERDAKYRFFLLTGVSPVRVSVVNVVFDYSRAKRFARVKRERWVVGGRGRYFNVARDRVSGRFISVDPWSP